MTNRYCLPGSDRGELQPHGVVHPPCHPQERAEITIRCSTGEEGPLRAVAAFAIASKLSPLHVCPDQKLVKAAGSIENLEAAFGVELHHREMLDGGTHRAHYGPVHVPASMAGLITGVFGLDDRPCAKSRMRPSKWDSTPSEVYRGKTLWMHAEHKRTYEQPTGTFTPPQVAEAYSFPAGTGTGQSIALIELGGGFKTADLRNYWKFLGMTTSPTVQSVGVNGGKNSPGSRADGEVMLDIEIAGSIAPGATVAVYFAGNTDRDFLDAFSQAIHDTHLSPSVISCSWGGPECTYSVAALTAFDAILADAAPLGITVFAAAGDSGSDDGVGDGHTHVDFPASSPHVTACGGTKLVASGSKITSEVVWNENTSGDGATGGGYSDVFVEPSYQAARGGKWRGVPDVAGNADPTTGYVVLVDGQYQVVGGTSAVAPLYAALVARLNQITGKLVGFLNPVLYANPSVCNDVTSGNNGAYSAGHGWDPCTGLGSIDGSKLLAVLQS